MRNLLSNYLINIFFTKKLSIFNRSSVFHFNIKIRKVLFALSKRIFLKSYEFSRNTMDVKSIVKVIESILPPELAEKWDKTGLLISPEDKMLASSIFFTIDLTEAVVEEAIALKSNMIIAYHPPIFSPLPKLLSNNWKDRIVMKCVKNSIAVYSPHTVCDIVDGGVNDWLLKCFDTCDTRAIFAKEDSSDIRHNFEFTLPVNVNIDSFMKTIVDFELISLSKYKDKQHVILQSKLPQSYALKILQSQNEVEYVSVNQSVRLNPLKGVGRIANLKHSLKLIDCINLVKKYLNLEHVRFSLALSHSLDTEIKTVAVCAGSGASVLKDVTADLYFTGEMSHHEVLHAIHNNTSIILVEHSNSERGYLKNLVDVLQPHLRNIQLNISSVDKDPISII